MLAMRVPLLLVDYDVACVTAWLADPVPFRKLRYLGVQAIYMPATVTHITQQQKSAVVFTVAFLFA